MSEIIYLSTLPSLTLKLAGKRWQAVNGVFKLSQEAAAELEALLPKRPDISSYVKKVDMDEAAKKAKEWLAKQPPAAIKGPVTSVTSASSILRQAREAQKPENLTGMENPVNIASSAKDDKPLDVVVVPDTKPSTKGALLGRLGTKT
jgi:hypothetical protein